LVALTVRTLAHVALALVAGIAVAPSVAHADDDDDDPDGDFVPFRTRSIALGGYGHGTRVGGHSEGGFGPTLELAYGRGRWQYLAEGAYAASSFDDPDAPPTATSRMTIDGHVWRGAVGARWLARQFAPDSGGGIELFLLSLVGMDHFHYVGGAKLTRPEIALGMGVQGRIYRKPRIAFRLDIRLLFTPNDRDSALVSCRELCTDDTGSSTGFMTGMALAW
jgi:hypothetical protein